MSSELTVALGLFSLAAAFVVTGGIGLALSGDVIAARTGWGQLWVGTLLVAGGTSLPELVTVVSAVRIDAPSLAAGDIFGANMLNMSNLVLLLAIFGGRNVFQRILPQQRLVAFFAIALTSVAFLFTLLGNETKWWAISPGAIAILVVYLIGSKIIQAKSGESEEDETEEPTRSFRWALTVFTISAVVIFMAAPLLAKNADSIADRSGIAESFIGAVAVAFVTTLPELTTTATALRIGAHDLAVSNMYGSNAFNAAALGVADFFMPHESLFGRLDNSHIVAGAFAILLMTLGLIQLLRRRTLQWLSVTEPSAGIIVALYLVGILLVLRLAPTT